MLPLARWRYSVADSTPPGVGFAFLDYVALAFILPGGEELLRRGKDGWPVWIPGFALGIIILMFRDKSPQLVAWYKRLAASLETIQTIDFDYLPRSPLENGWTQVYNPDGLAEFGSDCDIPRSLRMKIVQSEVAIHYNIPPHASLADHVEFTAKYTNAKNPTMIFTRLIVGARDGSLQKTMDIKYYHGHLRVAPTIPTPNLSPDFLPEQTVFLPAKVRGGQLTFSIDLRDAVNLCVGDQGWMLKSIQGIRLRGNLSISSLVLSKMRQT
jgi:hypothetical protein